MNFSKRAALVLFIGSIAECACNSESSSPGQTSKDGQGGAAGKDASTLAMCPGDAGKVTELPSGSCDGSGGCVVELDQRCGPGIKVIPSTPPVFNCQCVSGMWSCETIAGGFGLTTCDDAGADN